VVTTEQVTNVSKIGGRFTISPNISTVAVSLIMVGFTLLGGKQ